MENGCYLPQDRQIAAKTVCDGTAGFLSKGIVVYKKVHFYIVVFYDKRMAFCTAALHSLVFIKAVVAACVCE